MERRSLTLETALRVLSAVNNRREPNPMDVRWLRGCADSEGQLPVDELACELIQKALRPVADRSANCPTFN